MSPKIFAGNNVLAGYVESFDKGFDGKDLQYEEVANFILDSKRATTSAIQRKFKIGYNRAARILDQMQEDGLVGPPNGSNPRDILRDTL